MMANSLVEATSGFWVNLAEPAVRSLAIGCLAAAALAVFRVKRVSLRLFVWTMVLYVALAMPFLGAFLPRLPFTLPGAARAEAAAQKFALSLKTSVNRGPARTAQHAIAASSTASTAITKNTATAIRGETSAFKPSDDFFVKKTAANSSKFTRRPNVADISPSNVASAFSAAPVSSRPISADATTKAPANRKAIPWMAIILGAYGAIAFVLLTQLLLGLFFSGRLARRAPAIGDPRALRILRYRACFGGLETTPRLAESEALAVPATLGVLRPVILLPADWHEWDDAKLDAVLAHEISHVARRDALTQRLSLIHRIVFWFSPLSWWVNRQIAELAEEASDEAALAGGADRANYAETLLEFFAQLEATNGRIYWQGVSMANGLRAARRVDRILSWNGANSMKKWLLVFIAAVAAPLIFVAGAAHPFITRAQEASQVKPKAPVPPTPAVAPAPATPGVVAPALPNAPEGGVVAPALAPAAPEPGVVAPVPLAQPSDAPTPAATPAATTPALMPVPGAPLHPPLVPGPIAAGSFAPLAPMTPGPGEGIENPGPAPLVPMTPMAAPALAGVPAPPGASVAPFALLAPEAQEGDQDIAEQLKATEEALKEAEAQLGSDSAQMRAAQHAAGKAAKIIGQQLSSQMQEAREALAEANRDMQEAEQEQAYATKVNIRGDYTSGGGRYVIMSGKDESVEMSGDDEDFQHARRLREKLGKDLIWFERDEKSYIITDPTFIAQAEGLFAPEAALDKQQEELDRQQDALSKQQDALGAKMDGVKVKVPDISPELQRVKAELDALRASGGTQRDLGRIQSEIGRLQSDIGRYQSDAGVQQSEIGRQQSDIGRQQGEIGRKQGEIGRQEGEIARKASRQLRDMFDDAIAKGIAKPE